MRGRPGTRRPVCTQSSFFWWFWGSCLVVRGVGGLRTTRGRGGSQRPLPHVPGEFSHPGVRGSENSELRDAETGVRLRGELAPAVARELGAASCVVVFLCQAWPGQLFPMARTRRRGREGGERSWFGVRRDCHRGASAQTRSVGEEVRVPGADPVTGSRQVLSFTGSCHHSLCRGPANPSARPSRGRCPGWQPWPHGGGHGPAS